MYMVIYMYSLLSLKVPEGYYEVGDNVCVDSDPNTVRYLQHGHGGWAESMREVLINNPYMYMYTVCRNSNVCECKRHIDNHDTQYSSSLIIPYFFLQYMHTQCT